MPPPAPGSADLPDHQPLFDSADHAASLFNLQTFGNVYSRLSNPTVAALEERGRAGRRTRRRRGRPAAWPPDDRDAHAAAATATIVAAAALYGGTVTQFASREPSKVGHRLTFVDARRPENFAAPSPNARAIFAETISNPRMNVLDIAAVAGSPCARRPAGDRQHRSPSPTCASRSPRRRHRRASAKYLGGHGTTMGGVIVESASSPGTTASSRHDRALAGYHGVKVLRGPSATSASRCARMEDAERAARRSHRPAPGRSCRASRPSTAAHGAPLRQRLRGRAPALGPANSTWVNYPACRDHPQHALVQRQMPRASELRPSA